ncbi:MAG TPA: M56 family metallopeptidase [Candidatus Angelobacter sp.]|nr:M56 family metallopeptidase [Candidatus Angelobacter sp.]
MFYLLCLSLCFAVFFIVTAGASLVLLPLLRLVLSRSDLRRARARARSRANLIFTARVLPALLGLVAALGLALPAFLKFEPSSTREIPGLLLLLLAGLGALIVGAIVLRCWRILRTTHVMQRDWLKKAQRFSKCGRRIPVYCVDESAPLLAVTGIFRPRIFISRAVAAVLDSPELHAALAHEFSHVAAGDNLKQFLLKISRPPAWLHFPKQLDSAWVNNSEIAADEGALAGGASALDLSSALVKVGRLSVRNFAPSGLAASHLVDGCGAATQARVVRLRELLANDATLGASGPADRPSYLPLILATSFVMYFALLSSLHAIHALLEFLVR